MLRNYCYLLPILVVFAVCAACSSGKGELSNRTTSADFQLNILADSYYGEAPECTWNTAVEPTESGCIVSVSATGATGQKALYFDLEYDAEMMHPVAAEPVDSALECEPLSVSILDDRGTVHFGMILPNPAEREGFNGDGVLATVEFAYGAADVSRRVSGAPVDDYSQTDLRSASSNGLGWYHCFSGDCNHDGVVTASDLTPVGIHFGVTFAPDNFWMDGSLLFSVDTDRNYEIGVSDITAIGRNFGADTLGGYNIYASTNYIDYPSGNSQPNGSGAQLIGSKGFDDVLGGEDEYDRRWYSFEVPIPETEHYYWVRPVDSEGKIGTPSRMITQLGLGTSRRAEAASKLSWDGQNSMLVWGYHLPGDYNQDKLVSAADLVIIGQNYGVEGSFDYSSVHSIVDSNQDSIVNMKDLRSIGLHYEMMFRGYAVFGSMNADDYPLFLDSNPVVEPLFILDELPYTFPFNPHYSNVPYLDREGHRMMIGQTIESPESGMYYWVRLMDGDGNCGTPSNMIQIP